MLYVAMTRGRDTNAAYLCERITGEGDHDRSQADETHVMRRGTEHDAAQLARAVIANHDGQSRTAHGVALDTHGVALPERVRRLIDRRASAVHRRRAIYRSWQAAVHSFAPSMGTVFERDAARSRDTSADYGLEL
jgi:hypothetical protein